MGALGQERTPGYVRFWEVESDFFNAAQSAYSVVGAQSAYIHSKYIRAKSWWAVAKVLDGRPVIHAVAVHRHVGVNLQPGGLCLAGLGAHLHEQFEMLAHRNWPAAGSKGQFKLAAARDLTGWCLEIRTAFGGPAGRRQTQTECQCCQKSHALLALPPRNSRSALRQPICSASGFGRSANHARV